MKKRIEKYFPAAINAIASTLQNNNPQHTIEREYQAYISSFGTSVLQMGLLPTVAVFADEESGSTADRRKLLKVMSDVLLNGGFLSAEARQLLLSHANAPSQLFQALIHANDDIRQEFREHLLDVAVAIKLCLRTFKLSEA